MRMFFSRSQANNSQLEDTIKGGIRPAENIMPAEMRTWKY